jgi:hypothetical protein
MTIPKIITSRPKAKVNLLRRHPELVKLVSSRLNKNTCMIVEPGIGVMFPTVESNGVMKISLADFSSLLHPLLKQFFSDLKERKSEDLKKSIQLFQLKLKILNLTKQEILLFSAKILIVLALSGLEKKVYEK